MEALVQLKWRLLRGRLNVYSQLSYSIQWKGPDCDLTSLCINDIVAVDLHWALLT